MRHMYRGMATGGLVSVAALAQACSDASSSGPVAVSKGVGSVAVTTASTGADLPAGFQFRIDNRESRRIGVVGMVLSVDVEEGAHKVYLLDLASNCTVSGPNPQTAQVTAERMASVVFTVDCVATRGSLRVTTATSGLDPDPTGYSVLVTPVGGLTTAAVVAPPSGSVSVRLLAGTYTVSLTEVESNCSVVPEQASRQVDVVAGADVALFFAVTCTPRPFPPIEPGSRLAFTSLVDRQIYAVGMDGTGLRRLTHEGVNARPAWSPDGRRIAFVRSGANSVGDIYLMDADGSRVVRRTVGSNFWSVAWSPDSRRLAVSTEGLYESDVWILSADPDGSSPVHVLTNARSPAWSPDGSTIAYVQTSGDDGYDALAVANADGTNARPITAPEGGRYGLSWSPDGQRLASSKCDAGRCDLFVMNADGSGMRRLTADGTVQEAAWSPDGAWIAVSLWTYSGSRAFATLAYVSAEGGAPHVVVDHGFEPSWRP